jgi:hypothetical protein
MEVSITYPVSQSPRSKTSSMRLAMPVVHQLETKNNKSISDMYGTKLINRYKRNGYDNLGLKLRRACSTNETHTCFNEQRGIERA